MNTEEYLSAEQEARRKVEDALRERVKELHCLTSLSRILQQSADCPWDLLQRVLAILPSAWQYDDAVARIVYLDDHQQTSDGSVCIDLQSCPLIVNATPVGSVEVGYCSKHPESDEGPFLKEERILLETVAEILSRAIERFLKEQAVSTKEQSYRLLAENTVDVIWSTDLDMNFTYVNPAVQSLMGYIPDELIGTPIPVHVQKDDLERVAEVAAKALAQGPGVVGSLVEVTVLRKDGSRVPVEIRGTALFDQDGTPIGLQGITRDITERRQAQKVLEQSEERHRHLFETMAQGSLFFDDEGNCLAVNAAAARILGRPQEELMAMLPTDADWDLIRPDGSKWPHEELPIAVALRTGQPVLMGVFNPLDQDYRWLRLSAIPQSKSDESAPVASNITFEDITELRQAEEGRLEAEMRLQRSQRIEAVGRLAGGIAHDFNNMLSIILGNTEMALSQREHSDPIQAELLEIQTAAKRSAELTQRLLAFARLQESTRQHLDLNKRIEESLTILKSLLREDVEWKWEPSSAPVTVNIDPAQLELILVNLIQNAHDALHNLGSISLKTEIKQLDETYPGGNSIFLPGLYAVLTVSDTGVGMDKATLSRAFDPFFSTKPQSQSSGLGLATVHGLVEQNGGFTNIHSELGKGTVVRVYFPQAQEDTAGPGAIQISGEMQPRGGSETIMLVEDETSLLAMTARILKRLGYRVLPADSAAKALELFREHGEQVDLLLTDVVMPHMNGYDMFLQMIALKPGLKSLFMSGYTFDILARSGLDQSKVQLLPKPFSLPELGHKVREILDS